MHILEYLFFPVQRNLNFSEVIVVQKYIALVEASGVFLAVSSFPSEQFLNKQRAA